MCHVMALKMSCSVSLPGTEVRLTGLPCQLVFQYMGMVCSCAFKISLKNAQPSWTAVPFRIASQGSLNRATEQAKVCPLQV